MSIIKQIVEATSAARQQANLKLRWPVKEVLISSSDKKINSVVKQLRSVLLTTCNTKKINVVKKKPKGEFIEVEFSLGKVYVNKRLDKKLLEEALLRELVREIQELRKKNNFHVKETITLTLNSDTKTNETLEKNTKLLSREVGAKKIVVGKSEGKFSGKLEFDNKIIEIKFDSTK